MLRALRSAAHVGCGSFSEYVERLFGYRPRTTQEKLRVAEALERLPLIARELEKGALSWCATRELTRVAAADTERAWLDAAMQQIRRSAGEWWDDDAVLLSMARHVLGGPADEGRSSYQVSLTVCAACSSGQQVAGGELVPVGDAVVAMAECDARHIGRQLPRAANQNAGVNDAHVGTPSHGDIDSPMDAEPRSTELGAAPTPRAKQSIPPAMRRAVLARDHHRCRVPGCTHATFVDVHHILLRAEGGRHDPDNLITLCAAHHRATHRGELIIGPDPIGAPTFRHADGTDYGRALTPQVVDAHSKVFSALRNLGFREREIRATLAELLADKNLRDSTAERLLREALCRIRMV